MTHARPLPAGFVRVRTTAAVLDDERSVAAVSCGRSQTGASASGFSIATTASPSAGIPRCSSAPSDALAETGFRIPLINTPAFVVVAVIPVLPFGRSLGVDFFDELTDLDWGSWEGSLPESSSLGGDGTPLRGAFSADASSAGIYELTAGKTLSIFAGDGDILMPSACGGLAHSGPPKWPTLSPPPTKINARCLSFSLTMCSFLSVLKSRAPIFQRDHSINSEFHTLILHLSPH